MRIVSGLVRTMLAGAAFGALVFVSPSHAQELKELNILLPNNNTTGLYPVIVNREFGFFEKAGIKVNWLEIRKRPCPMSRSCRTDRPTR